MSREPLLGRVADLAGIADLVPRERLVTIVGPGGIGKTAVALALQEMWGCPLVDLSRITTSDGVAAVVANTLGAAGQSQHSAAERIVRHLGDGESVLILDNCEHVLDGVRDLVVLLLGRCPGVHILATSTVRLELAAEHLRQLGPLTLPDPRGTLAEIRAADAVLLFCDRVRRHDPDFAVTDANRDAVVDIVHRLDGLPLALELAAARMSALSAVELAERLGQRFAVLTKGAVERPARHQTLRALVEWSHERCTVAEQTLWARLSVFNGSFRLQQVEEVCAFGDLAADTVLDVLDGLISRSLLQVEKGERVRYRQLATIRDFGAERLAERGEVAQCRDNLLAFTLRATAALVQTWVGPQQAASLATWRLEHGTIMAALEWAIVHPDKADDAARLLALLRYHWVSGGYLGDGRDWFDRVLACPALTPAHRGHAAWVAAWVCLLQGDLEDGRAHLALAAGVTDPEVVSGTQLVTALVHMFASELPEAVAGYQQAIATCLAQGDLGLAMSAMFQLGMAQTYAGHHDEAIATAQTLIDLAEEHGEQWNRAYGLWIRGLAHWHRGDLDEAEASCRDALRIQLEFCDGICIAMTTLVLLWVRVARGDDRGARRINQALAGLWELLGTNVRAFGQHVADEHARRGPAEPVAGPVRPIPIREAVRQVLGLDGATDADAADDTFAGGDLSPREREVVAFLAEGWSNKRIADRLVISQRTVEGHVSRILAKLGLGSRAEVASWFVRRPGDTVPP